MTAFQLTTLGGPFEKRLRTRRASVRELPWDAAPAADEEEQAVARLVWTRSAFSELASAAAFAELAAALVAAGAPLDLVAACGDFLNDELFHAELSGRVAATLGGGAHLDVDLERLVRPAEAASPLLRACELVVRTCCVGESLTVGALSSAREHAGSDLARGVVERILVDESAHAELGWWALDWAASGLDDDARTHLGRAAGGALRSFAPLLSRGCAVSAPSYAVQACDTFDPAVREAARRRVAEPLAERGIEIPREDLEALGLTPAARST